MLMEINKISSGYGEIQVLWDVSLKMDSGEVIAVIGPNGAGKTTLLRNISGLLPLKNGNILFQGQDISRWPPHRIAKAGVVHIQEGRRLFGPLTVTENLVCGLHGNPDKSKRQELFDLVFELFPILRERRTQHAETLSGGEAQMLAIARALMSAAKLLLVDEPSLGLAPLVIEALEKVLRSLRERGQHILLVEQNCHLALSLATRLYLFENGRVALEGTPQMLSTDPRIKEIYLG